MKTYKKKSYIIIPKVIKIFVYLVQHCVYHPPPSSITLHINLALYPVMFSLMVSPISYDSCK